MISSIARLLIHCCQLLAGFVVAVNHQPALAGSPRYSAVRLQLPPGSDGMRPEQLSGDGLAAGGIHQNISDPPYDVAAVWDQAGAPHILPVDGPYIQALAYGFTPQSLPIGQIRRHGDGFGVPVVWSGPEIVFLPVLDQWGFALAGNDSTFVGALIEGTATNSNNVACYWDAGGVHLVPGLEGLFSRATAINS